MGISNRRPLWDGKDAPAAKPAAAEPDTPAPAGSGATTATPASRPPPPPPAGALAALPPQQQQPSFKQPCTLKGAASALYAGALGYFLGVVPATIKFKARQWGMIHMQGLTSAKQLALMSGMYTAVHCICQRIRLVEDGWNRGVAGCSTGLVLGWSNGPWGALQSCAGLGLISALIDLGGGVEAAEARVLLPQANRDAPSTPRQQQQTQLERLPADGGAAPQHHSSWHKQQHQSLASAVTLLQPAAHAVQQLLAAPPLMFLGACCQQEHPAPADSVDGCPLGPLPAARASGRPGRWQ